MTTATKSRSSKAEKFMKGLAIVLAAVLIVIAVMFCVGESLTGTLLIAALLFIGGEICERLDKIIYFLRKR